MEVTLARALKIKNQLVREIGSHLQKIQAHNSYQEPNKPNFDVKAEYDQYRAKQGRLIAVKTAIAKANTDNHEAIIRMSELKGMITQLRGIPTGEGKSVVGYGEHRREVVQVATLTDNVIDSIVKGTEKEIEELQDELDRANHKTMIEIPA